MSDLGSRSRLARSRAQLPVSAYFDESLYRREQELLFARGPHYIGHELMVPEAGDFHVLPQEKNGRMLVREDQNIRLLSNVCRHRQAVIQQGRGNAKNIVCPLHRWTYDLSGELLGAPHFPDNPCLNLHSAPLANWRGLLFEGAFNAAAELAGFDCPEFDFSGYRFDRIEIHECAYNWKTFIEVYLEDYHVGPFHPGLGQFVTCEDLRWNFGERHSVQTVGVNKALSLPGTAKYKYWHEQVLKFSNGVPPKQGAIWLTIYPNIMLEWYPQVLVVSTLTPRGPRHTTNIIEFYYPEEIVLFEREFVEAEQAAYKETCAEDDEIALRMDAGREALLARGESDAGPYQSPMEDGMQHFHEWIRAEMHQPETE
jgi:choline monooxygenase